MYLWLETTFGTVQKWSLGPLLDSLKGSLNIGILLYIKNDVLNSIEKMPFLEAGAVIP